MKRYRWVWTLMGVAGLTICLDAATTDKAPTRASPFVPAAKQTPPPAVEVDPELEALELAGISIIGDEQRFNLVDTRSKKSFWIVPGTVENGIVIQSYDPETDTVLVRRGKFSKRLGLRQSQIVAVDDSSGKPPPIKTAPGVPDVKVPGVDEIKDPQTPEQVKQAEYEARMLVSDLLEISMQERARQRALREKAREGK